VHVSFVNEFRRQTAAGSAGAVSLARRWQAADAIAEAAQPEVAPRELARSKLLPPVCHKDVTEVTEIGSPRRRYRTLTNPRIRGDRSVRQVVC
jgi:hypothetical protein